MNSWNLDEDGFSNSKYMITPAVIWKVLFFRNFILFLSINLIFIISSTFLYFLDGLFKRMAAYHYWRGSSTYAYSLVNFQQLQHEISSQWRINNKTYKCIEKTIGRKIDEFAKEYLFQPLRITRFEWLKYREQICLPQLRTKITIMDLLKFGLLYNNHRIWKDKQVVPEKWLEESFQGHVQRPEGRRMAGSYGYQFWLRKTR